MAETLNFTFHWELSSKPEVTGGSLTVPIAHSLTTGQPHYAEHTIADNYGKDVLWTAGDGGKDTFELCIIVPSVAVFVELRNDASTPDFVLMQLAANMPLLLTTDDMGHATSTALDSAVLVEATDYDQVDRIEVNRDVADAVGDAIVKLWMW